MVSREVVFGMDDIERKVSFIGVGVAVLISLISLVAWIKKSPVTTTQKYVKGKACPADVSKTRRRLL